MTQNVYLGSKHYNLIQAPISEENNSWIKRLSILESNWVSSVAIDSNDNIYILGGRRTPQSQDYCNFLFKFNKLGELLWQKFLYRNISYYKIVINEDDNLFLAGNFEDNQKEYHVLSRYDNTGKQLWNKTWGGYDWFTLYDMELDSLDNIYVVGSIVIKETNFIDAYLAKLNSTGSILWNQTLGGENIDEYYSIAAGLNNSIFLAGTANDKAILVSYNSSGSIRWNYTWNFPYHEQDILVDSDGYIIITDGMSLKKLNSTGNLLWNYKLPKYSVFYTSLTLDVTNDIYIAENRRIKCYDNSFFLESICICTAIYLEKINSSGSQLWEKKCTGCADASCSDIAMDSLGNVYITGQLKGEFGCTNLVNDAILMKNPKNFVGECVEIYYDLLFLIITPIMLISLVFLISFIKKQK